MFYTMVLSEARLERLHDFIDQGLYIARIISITSDTEDCFVTVVDCDELVALWFYLT